MRKWLVGLLAAGLCASSAWATTDVLTRETTGVSGTNYKDWTATLDSGTAYSGNSAGGNDAIQLRTNNSNSGIVTTDSNGNATKVTIAWNENTAADRVVDVYGKDSAYGSPADLYSTDTQGDKLGSFKNADGEATELTIDGNYAFIGLRSSSGALYLDSVEIEWAGGTPPVFSVKLDPAEDFEVFQGKSASITATVKGAQGDITYSWSVNGTPIDLAGNVYTVDSAELGEYEVAVEVSDGVAEPLSASVKYTVVEAPVVSGDVLTRETTGVEGSNYKDWTATGDSGTKYAGQSAGGNDSIQLRTTSPAGIVVTESAGSDVASVTVEWNDATAEKRSIEIYGSADAYAGPADLYGDAKGTLLGTLAKGETTLAVPEGYPYVGILAKGGALYLTSVAFEFAGEAGLSVTLDKANGFTVDLGTADSITATAKNGVEPYTYAWTSDTPDLNGTGETLAIPATLAEGDYTVQVEVTDAESNKASKQIYFSVAAPLEPHAININVGIQNGTVTSDPEGEAVKGTQVKLTATATTEGYALKEMTVTYGETVLTFTASPATFEMPDEAVSVGAVFAEVKDYAELPFVAEDTPYSGPWQKATIDGLTSKGLGTDYTSGGEVGAKFDTTGDWMQIKFDGTPGTLSFGIKGNSLSETNISTFVVQESATGGDDAWTTIGTYVTGEGLTGTKTDVSLELSASSQFVRFFYETKGAGNVGIYDVYITSGGPATFSIKLDPASYFEVEVGEEASIAATPKNAEGEVHYAWTVGGEPAGSDSAVLGLDTTAATEKIEVVCTATDAADTVATASVSYKVVAPAPKYAVNVALGIQNGTVTTDVPEAAEGDLVTVTATPEAGYRLVEIIVNNGEVAVTGNTFVMPGQDVLVTATFEEKPPVTGDVLTNDDVGSQTSSYKDWTATKESGAVYAGQTAGGSATNPCIQLRSTSNSGIVMTKDSGQNVASVTIEWNAQSAAERVVQVYGSTTPYSSPADLYGDAKGTLLGELTNGSGEVTVDVAAVGEFPYIGIRSKSGALFLTSVAIDFGGAAAFSIALDPAEDFEVQQGKDAAITATVRSAQGDVTYSWSVNGTPIDLAGNVYAIDSAEVGGPFTVVCEASDGVSEPVSASVSYTVVEVPPVTGDEFELISSLEDLEDGAEYVITDNTKAYAMKAELSSGSTKRLLNEAVEPVDDVITTEDASIIWKLVEDADGNYAFYNESAGKYIGWSSGNSAKLQDDAFANTISYEENLFVVMATSTAELDKPRKLQFNSASNSLQFAYYEGTQKNLNFFKKAGASAPKIVYSGETTIALGGTFEIIFGLLNYDGDFAWEMGSREGGTIVPDGRDGLYTWTPTSAGDVTIKVVARSGELDIASKEVVLTVTEPGPQPGEPAIVFGGDDSGVVGQPVTFTVASVNVVSDPTVYPDGFDASGAPGSQLADGDINYGEEGSSREVSFTPDVPGIYVFTFVTGGEGAADEVRNSVSITVTGEGPQPTEAGITKMTIAAGKMTIEFFGEGAQVLLSSDLETWTPVDGAISPYTIEMGADPQYIGVR